MQSADGPGDLRAVGAILREVAPTALLLLPLLALVALWQQRSPAALPPRRGGVEAEVIRAQLERTRTIPTELDVLTIGDSSGLMGVDAELLGDLLGGAKVESLSMLGFVGPRGFAAVLERFIARGGRTRRLLVLFHGASLNRPPTWRNWERMVIQDSRQALVPRRLFDGVRARLLAVAEPILYVPIGGRLGDFYGPSSALGRFIRDHHGSALEPGTRLQGFGMALSRLRTVYTLTEEFRDGIDALAGPVAKLGRDRTRMILMPEPDVYDSEDVIERRNAARAEIVNRLSLDPATQIDVPAFLSYTEFATATHLNPAGRERFTRLLAQKLSQDRAARGW